MTIDKNDLLNSILSSISRIDYIKSSDIPNIDLYMDQVTSFMEKELKSTKRYEDDKILTKTMINNYAKDNLLPAPIKKKYSKEHLLLLIFIYYFKNIMSMKDIEMLLGPITERYFDSESDINMTRIYDEVCAFEKERTKLMMKDIEAIYQSSNETFQDVKEDDQKLLRFFSFICSLSLDVYVKKLLIEKLIDELPDPTKSTEKEKEVDKDHKDKKK